MMMTRQDAGANAGQADVAPGDPGPWAEGTFHGQTAAREVHRHYGLWIERFIRRYPSPARDPATCMPRAYPFYDLSHMFAGRGWYRTADGRCVSLVAGDAVLATPGFMHICGGDHEDYVEDAVSFSGPVALGLHRCGVIQDGVFHLGRSRRLLPIIRLLQENTDDAHLRANLALQSLLMDMHQSRRLRIMPDETAGPIPRLLEAIRADYSHNWSVRQMAEHCSLSVNQFLRRFRRHTGQSPKFFVDDWKMQHATELLLHSDQEIHRIALAVGYPDAFHFSRRFKQMKGLSPEQYRAALRR